MTINATDIKLLESEVMADTTDGGGRRTSRVIVDGAAGNIFPKVSRLDSVYGRVNLRKVFGAVQTTGVDVYAGSHAVITDAPDNEKIHCTLFSTGSEYDTRSAARDRIESYVTSGPESRMVLMGRQLAGQKNIVVYQRTEEPLPEVGEVYCLSAETGSTVTAQQYFRVQTVDSEIRTFTESIGSSYVDFKRRVVTLGTGVALRYDFSGPESPTQNSAVARPAKLRTTTVVDAARYFGIQALAETAEADSLEVKVASVYAPIVPTTNRETALSNLGTVGASNVVAAKTSTRSETVSASWAGGTTYRTLRPITPGSLSVSGAGVTTLTDDKKGTISNSTFSATVDYEQGTITRTGGSAAAGSYTLTYTPGGVASNTAQNVAILVTASSRGTVYSLPVSPLPAPGTFVVEYRALGKWYRLRDDDTGTLSGSDAAYGVGRVDYTTGTLDLTLGALPDVGSSIVLSWGTPLHYKVMADGAAATDGKIKQTITLPDLPVAADSLSLTYTSGGVQYTATDDSAGNITGSGIAGKVNYTTGVIDLEYTTRLPDANTAVAVAYSQLLPSTPGDVVARSMTHAAAASIALGTGVVAGSFNASLPFGSSGFVYVADNGAGLIVAKGGQTIAIAPGVTRDARIPSDQVIGAIDYTTGAITINGDITVDYTGYTPPKWAFGTDGRVTGLDGVGSWSPATGTLTQRIGATANYGWKDSGITTTTASKTYNASFETAKLRVKLVTTERLVPGSLMFSAGGKTFIDRAGSLYLDVSNLTGAGTLAGTVDYETGEVALSTWTNGASLNLTVAACLTTYGDYTAYEVFFRTAGSPLRPGSFYIRATTENGTLLTGTTSEGGAITGTKVTGTVDQETGVVHVKFGQMVSAAGNESAWWYDADAVVGGMIFKPEPIIPATLRYNAVVLSNLPLNADILGLDPVRLPSDGRVPIYRQADVAVIHNTQSHTLTNPAAAGATYSVGRTDLADLWLVDQLGNKVSPTQYSVDLTAGTVTMGNPLNLTGLTQPLVAKHRIEDMALLTDVQINGLLALASPITREYPAGSSYISSAVLFGDMYARATNVHDLLAFASWQDALGTQAQATAQYNNIDYPIEVKNDGAVTERWRINFTSTTAFQVIGENLGVIATGSTGADCSPTNSLTGKPYFTLRAAGWGAGWAAGNQLRFNTISATAPIWIARTVLPGAALTGDSFSLQVRGDVDAPE